MSAQRNEVITREEAAPVVASAATILQVVERAAANPQVDIDKMERLLQMHERIVARDAEAAFNEALAECQREIHAVAPDATNPQTRSQYATYARLDNFLRPIYTPRGFSISFDTADCSREDYVRVVAYVSKGGHTRTYHIDMPADGKGAKGGDVMTKTHASGAAMSYGMRYLLKMIFNVAVGEYDNDGNMPAESEIQTAKANLEAAAKKGMKALEKAWTDLPAPLKVSLKAMKEPLKHQAADVDATK